MSPASPEATRAWPPRIEPTGPGLIELVRLVSELPRRERWTRERTWREFGRRSPNEVLRAGEVPYIGPCPELSSLAALALQHNGLEPTLILTGIQRSLQAMKFQTGLEVDLDGERWVIGFAISSSYCYAGRFVETPRRPQVLRQDASRMDPDTPFLAWFDPAGVDALERLLSGYALRPHFAHLASHGASRLRYAWHRRKALDPRRAEGGGRVPGGGGRWA
ncbi:MAG: hypothetical protein R3F62_20110 [Planctomycetota bacterium]